MSMARQIYVSRISHLNNIQLEFTEVNPNLQTSSRFGSAPEELNTMNFSLVVPLNSSNFRAASLRQVLLARLDTLARALKTLAVPLAAGRPGEAEMVRQLALRYERSDPSFASDLYAAAARHNREA
jgi:hypothetical protein